MVNAELAQLRQQTGNFDWEAETAGLEQAKAQLHDLDKQASSISGELSGLGKVCVPRCSIPEPLAIAVLLFQCEVVAFTCCCYDDRRTHPLLETE